MSVALHPRTYFLVDRVAKLIGILGIVAALVGFAGPFSPLFGLVGLAIGVSTIFIDVDE
jgi:uncharacterized membrane protein YkgB